MLFPQDGALSGLSGKCAPMQSLWDGWGPGSMQRGKSFPSLPSCTRAHLLPVQAMMLSFHAELPALLGSLTLSGSSLLGKALCTRVARRGSKHTVQPGKRMSKGREPHLGKGNYCPPPRQFGLECQEPKLLFSCLLFLQPCPREWTDKIESAMGIASLPKRILVTLFI